MKREIKFRGKDRRTGEWYYGNLYDKDTRGRTHICTTTRGCLDIDPDTVGQFIGRKDSKKAEIYEGDIFTVNGKYPKLVEYREDRAAFCIANVDELDKEWFDPWQQPAPNWWNDFSREIVVIGNKFDNPELYVEV